MGESRASREIRKMRPFSVDDALRVAEILGPTSAAALALCELLRRQQAGEDVGLFRTDSMFVVGLTPPAQSEEKP